MTSKSVSKQRALQLVGVICAVLCAAIIFGLSCVPGSSFPSAKPVWSVVIHFTEYACLGFCIAFAWSNPKRSLLFIFLTALLMASAYGLTDELHQFLTPNRCPDWKDWAVDTCGGAVGAGIASAIIALQGWCKKTH